MKTVTVHISDSDIAFIRSLRKEEEGFTEEAVAEKIAREKRTALDDLLKEGYQSTSEEDLSIAIDFQDADSRSL